MDTLISINRSRTFGLAKFCLFVAITLIATVIPKYLLAQQSPSSFSMTSVVIETRTDAQRLTMELAEDAGQHALGLMGRQSLASDSGMIFVYARPRRVSMWMKDTLIPLDMLFVRLDGIIESIVERTTPLSLTTIRSEKMVRAVIELNAGTAKRLGIEVGNRVIHDAFNIAK